MMDETVEKPFAWQPLTVRGVAAFASASWARLLLVQLLFALLAAATLVWFVQRNWFPVLTAAVDQLPAAGEIRVGTLNWAADSPQPLAENHFLAVTVDLNHQGEARSPAHLQVEFGQTDCWLLSLFGSWPLPYPKTSALAFNRPEVEPWWGAWQPVLLALLALAVGCGLLLTWLVLATLYVVPAWLVGFFANRELSLGGSWRLAGAALMPGALFMCGAILVYGLGAMDPPRLLLAVALHLVLGWLYLALSPLSLPLLSSLRGRRGNPFRPTAQPLPLPQTAEAAQPQPLPQPQPTDD